jgi:hypothetical protein
MTGEAGVYSKIHPLAHDGEVSGNYLYKCRLCDGVLAKKFNCIILNKHDVTYYLCSDCSSLQTEHPHWLDEAYSVTDFNLDTGALQRNINNFAACYTLAKLLSVDRVIDFGGKDGLLCRFLRDHLIDCYVYDKYSKPSYSIDFEAGSSQSNVDLVLAFEVFEHLPNPRVDLEEIFSFQSKYVLVTTDIYSNQGSDWWYLAKEGGQHVFFYSAQAINFIARKYGYGVTIVGSMILFFKEDIPEVLNKIVSSQTALDGWIFQAIKSYVFLLPTPGVGADYNFVKNKLSQK